MPREPGAGEGCEILVAALGPRFLRAIGADPAAANKGACRGEIEVASGFDPGDRRRDEVAVDAVLGETPGDGAPRAARAMEARRLRFGIGPVIDDPGALEARDDRL